MADQVPPGFILQPAASAAGGAASGVPSGFVPEKPSIFPSWIQDLAKYGPGFLKETGLVAGKAALSQMANLGEGAGALAGEGMRDPNVTDSIKPQAEIQVKIPDDMPQGIYRRMVEGAGGAMALPIPGVGLGAQLLAGAGGGLGGYGGRRVGEAISPGSLGLQSGMDILGSLFGGGVTGFASGPKQSVGQADIRKALTGTTSGEFTSAIQNAGNAQNAGAKTATAAEMFEPGSGVMALASKTRASSPNNALRLQTTNRPGDIQDLANEFLNRIHPPVDPNTVANRASGAANDTLATTRDLRGTGLSNTLAGEVVQPAQVSSLQGDLLSLAKIQDRPDAGNAYRLVAKALTNQNGQPITSVQELSLAIKSLKDAAKNPNSPIFSGAAISGVDLSNAIRSAEAGLGDISPAFKTGMEDFRNFSQSVITPQRQGPIGSLADRNPLVAGQTSVSRLAGLLSGNSPQTVGGVARTLADPVMTGGQTVAPTEIARALAQRTLAKGPANPGAAVRGTEGSDAQQAIEALLQAGGNDAKNTMLSLSVADRLQPFATPANVSEAPKMQALQLALRPFRTMDMASTGRSINSVNEEVAKILANPSPENLRKIQEMAMFDPALRKALSAKSGILSALPEQ